MERDRFLAGVKKAISLRESARIQCLNFKVGLQLSDGFSKTE